MGKCPDPMTLERLARGELTPDEAATVEHHAESCRRCAEALASLWAF